MAQSARDIHIKDAWLRPAPAGMSMTGGYLVITNTARKGVRLRSASSPDATAVTLHRSVVSGGIARMESLPRGLDIAPGASIAFQPGGNHLMLDGLKHPLKIGDKLTITLSFDGVGAVPIGFEVRAAAPASAMPPGMKMR